jgi:hypothetical protein
MIEEKRPSHTHPAVLAQTNLDECIALKAPVPRQNSMRDGGQFLAARIGPELAIGVGCGEYPESLFDGAALGGFKMGHASTCKSSVEDFERFARDNWTRHYAARRYR